MRVLFRHLD